MKILYQKLISVLLIFVLSLLLSCESVHAYTRTLEFAQISDIHYSTIRNDNAYKLLSQSRPLLLDAIEQINKRQDINFVMITGDGIDRPLQSSLLNLADDLNTLKFPWYYVVGNHDTTPEGFLCKANLIKILNEKNANYTFDSSYYSFVPKKGFKVIVLDGAKNDKISSNGIISEEQLKWMDNELNNAKKNETVLIFSHFPLLPPYDSKNHELLNAKDVKDILNKYKMPIAIFSGHYHMTKITKRGNILHVSTPSLAGYPNAFRIIEVKNKSKEVVFNIELVETGLKDLQAKTKIMALGGAVYYGKPQDRTTSITISRKK